MTSTRKRILIIEDERSYAEMVKLRLELSGFECAIAETTQKGLSALQTGGFDLFILDLMLPGGSGFAVLDELKKSRDRRRPPVVVLTGKTVTAAMKATLGAYPVAGFFSKPYDPEEFLTAIHTILST